MNPDNPTYEQMMESRLKAWRADIEKIKERAEKAPEDVKKFCLDRAGTLEAMERNAFAQLRELRNSGDDEWEALRTSIDSHWDEMRKVFAETYEKLQ